MIFLIDNRKDSIYRCLYFPFTNTFKSGSFILTDLIYTKEPLTFLVGAGISIDLPSNLASAREMINAIIKFTSPKESWNKVLAIPTLRYEYLIQRFIENFDSELKIMQYFEQSTDPNLIHHFLAEMITKGHFVLTTNFDYLLEYALKIDNLKLKIVITKQDFEEYGDPDQNFQNSWLVVYKIHGSMKNIQTEENTRKSLITTLDDLTKNKNGDILSVEIFKRAFFEKATKNRTLVILGYSGADDFDIMPTLLEMKEIKRIIWIEHHDEMKETNPISIKIDEDFKINVKKESMNKLEKTLSSLNFNELIEIFYVKAHTEKLINSIFSIEQKKSNKKTNVIKPFTWISSHFLDLPISVKYAFIGHIFYDHDIFTDSLNFYSKARDIFEKENDLKKLSAVLGNMGLLYHKTGEQNLALEHHQKALKINEKESDELGTAIELNNIGNIYLDRNEIAIALDYYQKAYDINEKLGNIKNMLINLANLGIIYKITGKPNKALECFQKAISLNDVIGDLECIAINFGNIGNLYHSIGDIEQALENCKKAYDIVKKLNDTRKMAANLINIGAIYNDIGNFQEANINYKKAYYLGEKFNDFRIMGIALGNIGIINREQGKIDEALVYHQKAFTFLEKTDDKRNIGYQLRNIGICHQIKGDLNRALDFLQKTLKIFRYVGDKSNIAAELGNIGNIYKSQGNLQQALQYYQEAYDISEKIDAFQNMVYCMCNIGMIITIQGKIQQAYELFQNALHIAEKIRDINGIQFAKDCIADLDNYQKNH